MRDAGDLNPTSRAQRPQERARLVLIQIPAGAVRHGATNERAGFWGRRVAARAANASRYVSAWFKFRPTQLDPFRVACKYAPTVRSVVRRFEDGIGRLGRITDLGRREAVVESARLGLQPIDPPERERRGGHAYVSAAENWGRYLGTYRQASSCPSSQSRSSVRQARSLPSLQFSRSFSSTTSSRAMCNILNHDKLCHGYDAFQRGNARH